MNRLFLDVHALQTVPPSNLNRDDAGSPKSAIYGGVPRARVSSQAWKRAIRTYFSDEKLLEPNELGVRTKRVAELLARRITAMEPSLPHGDALVLASEVVRTATGSKLEAPRRSESSAKESYSAAPELKYLLFLSERQLDGLAELAIEGAADIKKYLKGAKARAKEIADTHHSVDIALFGRMVADSSDINVGAAVQVAHAISVHQVQSESDYYTAIDDCNTEAEPGAGMIGTLEFNSATLYRYATLNVQQLHRNLVVGACASNEPTITARRATEAFVHGFVASLPTGKINAFGHHTLPDAVIVKLRTTRPISFVPAFEEAVGESCGYVKHACDRLATYVPSLERAYGEGGSSRSWVLRVGPATESLSPIGIEVESLDSLITVIGQAVTDHVECYA
ncbi:type I-E CRISPR-associated protein Cas7/Cse4/CasC [Streptomyces lydicus]|uniref:type I-E CRISPR-associated protein Cas7/Cse4/CasC n=1 Tax=Streptomyces lydicus TaxID=47763 RepID=UPI0036E1F3A4